jgi:hypothetical protein
MNKRFGTCMGLVIGAILLWAGYRVYRAHSNLVTLHVHGMEVRKVISKLEWQTWERILVHKDVAGNVTLDVDDVPLDEVLNIVGLQTDARWTRLYPLYSTGKAAVDFKKVVRGDIPAEGSGWTNLQKYAFGSRGMGGLGGFGNTARAANNLVSAQILDKDLDFTALALSRFAQAQLIPQDGTSGNVSLKLAQVPFEKAVEQVAKQVHRKWDQIYALRSTRSSNTSVARKTEEKKVISTSNPEAPDVVPPASAPTVVVKTDNPRKPNEKQMEAFLSTMTPEEKQKAQEQMAMAAEIQALPPAEREQRMQEMAAQNTQNSQVDAEQRIQNRLKNGTVDQRIAHDRQQLKNRESSRTP